MANCKSIVGDAARKKEFACGAAKWCLLKCIITKSGDFKQKKLLIDCFPIRFRDPGFGLFKGFGQKIFSGFILNGWCTDFCRILWWEITGSPSSKNEHRRASALFLNIQNISICMGKKNYRFCNLQKRKDFNKKQLTLLKMCVTSLLCGPRADLWPFNFMGFYQGDPSSIFGKNLFGRRFDI